MPDPIFLSGDDVPDYLKGVELMTAGMDWPASTGPVTITREHIADAIRAANDDPHIQVPRIKLGHSSPINGDHPDHDPFAAIGDAEPAFGQFVNLRAANDGAVLVGDADNVIAWLAESAPSTYPNRSSEATWEVAAANFDVQTAGGKRYSMVVTAVSLLGVYIPAIGDLEDLTTLIMNGPSAVKAAQPANVAAANDAGGDTSLSVSTSTIRERFNFDWAMDSDNNAEQSTYWWWARDIRVDQNEVIADDDEGGLWSVPYTTDGEDAVTFGDPVRVRETFVPVAASRQVASFARPAKPSRPASTAATARPNTEGATHMDDQVREFLVGQGHDPDTASEAQVQAATSYVELFGTAPAATEETNETVTTDEPAAEAETEVTDEPAREPVAAAQDPHEATKDAALTALSAEVAELRQREATRLAAETKKRRDDKVAAAVTATKITPAEAEHYRGLYEINEERTDALLTALPAGRVPLEATAQIPDPHADPFPAGEVLPSNVSLLNPTQQAELRARRGA